jgi:PKD domain/Secretion system C-terminal sorting domain
MRNVTFSFAWFFLGAFLLWDGQARAQCNKVGWVASVTPGCGAKIIDLDNGQVYRAVLGADKLIGGQTISFSTSLAPMPVGCPPNANGQIVSLTCISDTLPCVSVFGYYPDANDGLLFNFEGNVYDPQTQICHWEFGDGSVATGRNVAHSFPQKGDYEVCLKVTDPFGNVANSCQTIKVDAQNSNGCGFDMRVTAVGTQLSGKVFPVNGQNDLALQSIVWYSSKSSNVLATTPELSAPLPGFGNYLVCAQYNVSNADGSLTCASTKCQALTVAEPGCVNPVMVNTATLCPSQSSQYTPVCGCNGIQYGNECEAISAGISSWWAGDCAAQGNNCNASMEVKILSGSLDDGYTAQFVNKSTGNFTYTKLDFGDDSDLWEASWDTLVHIYPAGGIYRTNLTNWKTGGCLSSAIQLVVTDALNMNVSSLPESTDYVRPGDANRDGKANVYDLLNLGVGHTTFGSPRPDASTSWNYQFSPNWFENLISSNVNYKHLDCDGNGIINEYDADVVGQNYAPIDPAFVPFEPNAPQVRLEFLQDTIVVNANIPAPIEIKGKLILGSPVLPAFGIYGLAFSMNYPEYVGHNPSAEYKSDFFGSPNHMLWLAKDNYDQRQLDLGVTRKNGLQASGYGQIAELTFRADFIIIIDIADRSSNKAIPFTVPLRGIRAIDNKGDFKYMTTPTQQDTVWIKLVGTTGTNDALAQRIALAPNPASDFVTLYFGDLQVASVETVNVFGQVLSQVQVGNERSTQVRVSGLSAGVYSLRIRTEKGVVEKQLVVAR